MSLYRDIDFEVQVNTWMGGKTVPSALIDLSKNSPIQLDILLSLLFIAIWTRPPMQLGFSLSDFWAWLRYLPAIDSQNSLRLREEWSDIDPHQKMILSDEFGVGLSTWLLYDALGFKCYADTIYVIKKMLPHQFYLGNTSKRGPNKSPDFIAIDHQNKFSVLECKGTQSSREELRNALQRGFPQKDNLHLTGKANITHSLVSGIFIPQWESREEALFSVRDPDYKELESIFYNFSPETLRRSILIVVLAKEFANLGFSNSANFLMKNDVNFENFEKAITSDLREDRISKPSITEYGIENTFSMVYPERVKLGKDIEIAEARGSVQLSRERLNQFRLIKKIDSLYDILKEWITEIEWEKSSENYLANLISPFGFNYYLKLG